MENWLLIQIQVTAVVLILLLLRPALHRLPKIYSYALWGLVFVRLLCPIVPESSFGVFPPVQEWTTFDSGQREGINEIDANAQTGTEPGVQTDNAVKTQPNVNYQPSPQYPGMTGANVGGAFGTDSNGSQTKDLTDTNRQPLQNNSDSQLPKASDRDINYFLKFTPVLVGIWLCGVLGILLYNIATLVRIRRHLNSAVCMRDNIYLSTEIESPFVAGIARPRIYIPAGLSPEEQDYILCHEQVHIRRKDYFIKTAAFLLTAVYWYNPFVWAAFHFMNEDMEMSCDEAVMEKLGQGIKKQYSRSLLHFATGEKQTLSAPLHFGENHVKKRVENVLSYKNLSKTAKRWIWAVGIIAVSAAGVLLFTVKTQEDNNPPSQPEPSTKEIEENSEPAFDRTEQAAGENTTKTEPVSSEKTAGTRQIQEVVRIDEDMDFSDALEELVTDDAAYYATKEGIFRNTEEGIDRFYHGYPGPRPCMQIYENRLYFLIDLSYEQGDSLAFVGYNGIRWVDLQTGIMGEQDTSDTQEISYFTIHDGFVTIHYRDVDFAPSHNELLADKAEVPVYEGSTLKELQPSQLQELGMEYTTLILENPNVLHHIAYHTKDGNVAFLDWNGDGVTEQISLGKGENLNGIYGIMDNYVLSVEDVNHNIQQTTAGFYDNLCNELWALSLDGEHIYLLLYEAGPSGDPVTHFFTYEEDGNITEQAFIQTDIRNCEITADGVIHGQIRVWIIQTDNIFVQWAIDENGVLSQIPQDTYDFTMSDEYEVKLLEELPVYNNPGKNPPWVFAPQKVHFLAASGDFEWILMEGEDGTRGWFQVKDGVVVAPDKWCDDVFEGLSHAG